MMTDTFDRLRSALADRYTIEREIGSGGMATVYLAKDLKHERQVAIKVLRPELATALGPDRFLQEIKIAANLNHPHILPLLDSGTAEEQPSAGLADRPSGFLYYVMPYIEGESLREKLAKEGELPIGDAVRILKEVVDALAEAHSHGVVHRDIKPDNVMLRGRHALVTDFGVAKAVSEATGRQELTTAGVALGTPAYMAPEQAAADPFIDHRADIYAVGAVAYELLTGRTPFVGTTQQELLAAHVTQIPDPVTKYRESVPPALAELVMKCLEKKAADRWQTAEELIPQLEALATPSGGVTPTGTTPVKGPSTRRGWVWMAVAAVLVAAAAIVLRVTLLGPSQTETHRVVVVPFENRTGDSTLDHLGMEASEWITRGLLETGLLEVVPTNSAMAISRALASQDALSGGAVLAGRVALEAGARYVVYGAFYVTNDTVRFQAEVADALADRLLQSLEPVSGPLSDVLSVLEAVRQRVMGALAIHVDPRVEQWATGTMPPPSYEAYAVYAAAWEAFFRDLREAKRLAYRAMELDSTWAPARLYAAIVHLNLGEYTTADSLAQQVAQTPGRLGPVDRLNFDFLRANLDGDAQASYRAVLRITEIAPSQQMVLQLGWEAIKVNRPREAIETYSRLDPYGAELQGNAVYWIELAIAHHMLGEYEQELVEARRAREQYPDLMAALDPELRALAALGRADEVNALLEESLNLPPEAGFFSRDSYGMRPAWVALEFRAHGYPDAYRETIERSLRWFESRPAEEQAGLRYDRGRVFYYAGRFEDAFRLFEELATERPDNPARLGWLGVTVAELGRGDSALAIAEQIRKLDLPYQRVTKTGWQAAIAAVLGDREAAMRHLRESYARGRNYGLSLHREPYWASLRDYPPFLELMRPKG